MAQWKALDLLYQRLKVGLQGTDCEGLKIAIDWDNTDQYYHHESYSSVLMLANWIIIVQIE